MEKKQILDTKEKKIQYALVYVGLVDFIKHKLIEMDDIKPKDAQKIHEIIDNLTNILKSNDLTHEEKSIAMAEQFSELDLHSKADLVLRSAIKSTFRTFLINDNQLN